MLGWVFWLASPFARAWHRHRVVLACTPHGWVSIHRIMSHFYIEWFEKSQYALRCFFYVWSRNISRIDRFFFVSVGRTICVIICILATCANQSIAIAIQRRDCFTVLISASFNSSLQWLSARWKRVLAKWKEAEICC